MELTNLIGRENLSCYDSRLPYFISDFEIWVDFLIHWS